MKIQTNTSANFALNYMSVNEHNTQQSIQRLSSGFRINRAGDDAAGLAIANKLRSDSKGLGQAQRNVAQATSMLQTMDGATQTVSSILDRMKQLATQANSANIGTQSVQLQKEFVQLRSEVDRISATTNYQGTNLLDGTFGSGVDGASATTDAVFKAGGALANTVSVNSALGINASSVAATYVKGTGGATPTAGTLTFKTYDNAATPNLLSTSTFSFTAASAGTTVTSNDGKFSIALPSTFDFTADSGSTPAGPLGTTAKNFALQKTGSFQASSSGSYGFGGNDQIQVGSINVSSTGLGLSTLDLTTQAGAATALSAIDSATNLVNTSLGGLGAAQSRLDFAATNVATAVQNTTAAESTIRDTDMAAEMTSFTKNNILTQAAQAMLSQANQGSQSILQLLR